MQRVADAKRLTITNVNFHRLVSMEARMIRLRANRGAAGESEKHDQRKQEAPIHCRVLLRAE
jgi:hypothetical protein